MDDSFVGVHRSIPARRLLYIGSIKNVRYVKRGRWLCGRTPKHTGSLSVVYKV